MTHARWTTPRRLGFVLVLMMCLGMPLAGSASALAVPPPAPTVTKATPLRTGEVGVAYADQMTATGGAGSLTWSVTAGSLPAGINLTTGGTLTGMPNAAGTASFTATVTDTLSRSGSKAMTLTVAARVEVTSSSPAQPGELGIDYSFTLSAAGGVGPYSWSIDDGVLPSGILLDEATGELVGVPEAETVADFTVMVTDNFQATATKEMSLTVVAAVTVSTTSLPDAETGVSYSFQLTSSGGLGPFAWSRNGNALPAGLSLSAAGLISGTPSGSGTIPGFRVTDSLAATNDKAFVLTVRAAVAATFTTPLPAGQVGLAYSSTLSKTGGRGPYSWSLVAGVLPTGVGLAPVTGAVSGTPTAAGTFNFTARVADALGGVSTKAGSLTIDKAAGSVVLSASSSTTQLLSPMTVTATLAPIGATGTVTFTDVPTTGPAPGVPVTLGSATITAGDATLSVNLPTFGVHSVVATYSGDVNTNAATSNTAAVEVAAGLGELIISEFRTSGPGGADDSYLELTNTGPPLPLAGFVVTSTSGASSTLPSGAGILDTNRSYLMSGAGYTLGSVAISDRPVSSLGSGGITIIAPDTAGTTTDSVGPSTGFHLGAGLPPLTGSPSEEYAFLRTEIGGRSVNSYDNAADFQLISTSAPVGGQPAALGSPSPTSTTSPAQSNDVLTSSLLDPSLAASSIPNREYIKGAPGQLTIRRTITNTGSRTVDTAKVRVTAISQLGGAPRPGAADQSSRVAYLQVIDPATPTSSITLPGADVTVQNLGVDAPAQGGPGGLNSTLNVPLNASLPPGASINIAITFQVLSSGSFWIGYDVDAVFATCEC